MKQKNEAYIQARKDIAEDLKKQGKSYISCSLKQLRLLTLLTL